VPRPHFPAEIATDLYICGADEPSKILPMVVHRLAGITLILITCEVHDMGGARRPVWAEAADFDVWEVMHNWIIAKCDGCQGT
jgi:hypothetical protein